MYNKASQNRQQAGWTRKLAFAGRRYESKVYENERKCK